MRRISLIALCLLAAAPLAAGTAQARRTRAAAGAPRAQLADLLCQTALDPPARAVSITAVMRPLAGTVKLAAMFTLEERTAADRLWTAVPGPGLGVWLSPTDPATLGQRPGDVWYARKPVADLAAPASYRFSVSFRWLGSAGTVLGSATSTSRVCRQPELRPDLTVNSVNVATEAGHPARDAYTAVIGNTGATAAGPFTVQLTIGATVIDKTIALLHPHQTRQVVFAGPLCDATAPPTVTVDPTDTIDVFSRTQATLAAQCSGPPATGALPVSG